MKTSEAFQVWTKCVENKWEGNRVPLYPNKRATELYFTFCVIWGYHVQNSTAQTLYKIET